jgi:PAS domain-containing protein
MRPPSGELTWRHIRSKPRRLDDGRLAWDGFSIDITDRKHAEAALRESEDRYRSVFAHSIDAILLTAPDGRIFAANPAACRIFERTEAEICQAGRDGLLDTNDPRLHAALAQRAPAASEVS